MPVYIASDFNGYVRGIVLAKTEELATAYWQGMGEHPHAVRRITANDLVGHPTGVLPLLRTKEESVRIGGFSHDKDIVRVVK